MLDILCMQVVNVSYDTDYTPIHIIIMVCIPLLIHMYTTYDLLIVQQ